MNKEILVLTLIFLTGMASQVCAANPYSKVVRNDGVEIKKCIDDFGKIDYCTVYDRNHADEIVKYPQKYSVMEESLIQNKTQNHTLQTFGESCMNVQYAIGTGMTLFNSVINAVYTIQRF